MAKITNNATASLSGKVDQFVYRQQLGRTVVSKPPRRSRKPLTAAQQAVIMKFRKAAAWAKAALINPVLQPEYKALAKNGMTAYATAVKDFLNAPVIEEINSSKYLGQAGGTISIIAMDDCKVATVMVRIEKSNGTLVEDGIASFSGDGLHWIFTSTVPSANTSGFRIIVTAADMTGNEIVNSKQFNYGTGSVVKPSRL